MKDRHFQEERLGRLVSQLVDGDLSREELDELDVLVQSDALAAQVVVDHILLDSLLSEDLCPEALTSLIDLVSAPQAETTNLNRQPQAGERSRSPAARLGRRTGARLYRRAATCVLAVTALILAIVVFLGRPEGEAHADATQLVRAALHGHAERVERVYVVDVEWEEPSTAQLALSRDVTVSTMGDRFWVESTGVRRFSLGRESDGTIWVALGRRRAVRIKPDEIGPLLHDIADIYSLNLESLLQGVLLGHELERMASEDGIHIIEATPKPDNFRWIRAVTIELDQETKAVRRLVMQRRAPLRASARVTFTLVAARPPDESKYQLEGHLREPHWVLSRDSRPDRRLAVLENWIGPLAKGWIVADQQRSD
jgi:hypothetical protein